MASESTEAPLGDEVPPVALTPVSPNKLSLKIIDPSRKKLVSPEPQRIIGVLDECIHKMKLVALLPSELTHPESLSVSLGEKTVRSLTEHLRVVKKHGALNVDTEETEQEATTKVVQNSLLNLLRLLRACPTAEAGLKRAGPITEDRKGVHELVAGLQELRAVVLERLLTTASEERERSRHIQEVSMRHRSNLEVVGTLEKEVAAAIKDRDEEISKQNEAIRRLKGSVYQMEKTSEDFVARTQQEAQRQNESDQKTSEGKQTHLQQEANQLRVQLNNLITEHKEAELALRKKKYKLETEIENWIQKYDTDMGEKQTELEEMTVIYEEEKAELRDLQEHYAVLELEYSQIMEERRIAQEQREEEEKEREVKSQAAVIIQAFWRGYCVRKVMKAKTKSKSKKAKKGKGKKGK
ncbi:dynein regulatory complex protein 10 [Colossoma macropomum]|uniref:dynein regulatory complex protein 10 n=1 Tax=Colossoma macropomum TaxID=42526 RepID=UPI0018642993|nr:dynein regulatory complex protein 10 [Colossoma macropomum]